MVNKTVILFPLPPASCGWVLQISFVQPESKLNIRWKYFFAIEVVQRRIKEGFFISEGQKRGGELEEPSLVSGAGFVVFQAEKK